MVSVAVVLETLLAASDFWDVVKVAVAIALPQTLSLYAV